MLELLDHLGWTSEVHAVGYSAGGQVLQQMLLLSPQRFKSIALVSTTAGGTRPFTGAYTLISNLFVSDPHEQLRRLMRINYTKVRMNIKTTGFQYHGEATDIMIVCKVLVGSATGRR